jgi:hypothetical protein
MDNDSSEILAIIFAVYAIIIVVSLLFAIAFYIVMSIALSRFFKKVGVEPWIAWVPYYSTWKWLEVGGQPGWLSLLSLIGGSIVTSVFLYIGMYRSGIAFGKDGSFLVLGIFLPFVWAFMLGRDEEQYHPERIVAAGFPPPLAGYGAMQRPTYQQYPPPAA